jgi:hypothetical protein
MNSAILDVISPSNLGEDKIDVSLDLSSYPLLPTNVITLNFDYSRTQPNGVVKPLKFQLQPMFGAGAGYLEVLFDSFLPDSYSFQVQGAGSYLAVIREVGHNLWRGSLVFTVGGDQFQEVRKFR